MFTQATFVSVTFVPLAFVLVTFVLYTQLDLGFSSKLRIWQVLACKMEGVAESNCDNLVLGMDRTTMSSIEALGGTCIDKGAMYSGISGGDLRQAGCNTSESEGIETTLKENG